MTRTNLQATKLQNAKGNKIALWVFLAVSIVCFSASYYMGQNMIDFLRDGIRVTGEVVDLERRESHSDDGPSYAYYAIIEYEAPSQGVFKFSDSVGSSKALFALGDRVDVIFDPEDTDEAIIDRGLWNWALSGGLFVVGLLCLWSVFYLWLGLHISGRRKFRERV